MKAVYVCSKCEWKFQLGLDFGSLKWLPFCPVCNSIMEGFRIL